MFFGGRAARRRRAEEAEAERKREKSLDRELFWEGIIWMIVGAVGVGIVFWMILKVGNYY